MKILLVEHNLDENFLDPDPTASLRKHYVSVTDNFMDAQRIAELAKHEQSPFQVALIDILMPGEKGGRIENWGMVLAASLLGQGLVACYVHLPSTETQFKILQFKSSNQIIVATNGAWTVDGQRDRKKMLSILKYRFEHMSGIKIE